MKGIEMNLALIGSVVRWVLTTLAGTGFAAAYLHGIDIGDATNVIVQFISALVALVTLIWSIWQKIKAAKVTVTK